MKKCKAVAAAAIVAAASLTGPFSTVGAADSYDMNINVDLGAETKEISPYIYGINQYGNQDNYNQVDVTAVRQGGNRMTAYNWETNASNAGSDWLYSSDDNLSSSDEPADCVQTLSKEAETYGFTYKLTTLQLAGYVAADKNGTVTEDEAAPSDRWNEVVLTKDGEFDDTPDLDDGVVYMDEYVNYIINTLGDSTTSTGIQAYSLDNEPVLWMHTHSRIHPDPVTIAELTEKSVEMATAVKELDPNAEIFGPALYGYTAYDHLADDESSDEWETLKAENNYNWYIDCYLDQMKQASDEAGVRLLDVLDIHYYSESANVSVEDRLQSVRTLYEEGFVENSWIGQWCQSNIPILPTIQESIDTYFPGTKLAITEYSFGGEDLSGTIAQAEALGCYADAGVYFASLWGGNSYQFAGINLYTNYDGNGSSFGDMLVPTETDDVSLSSSYASINGTDEGTVTAMITNKDLSRSENVSLSLDNANTTYEAAAVYAVYGDSDDIRLLDIIDSVENNTVEITLPAYSAAMVVVTDDASDFEDLKPYNPDDYSYLTETFDNPSELINGNGFVEVPISDPSALKEIRITADVTSSAGSSWASAGCAVCINAVDSGGTEFWTSKGYSLGLGSGSEAVVEFDGTLSNNGDYVDAQVADGKVELQKWWDASEKAESGVDDVISVSYTKIEVIYEYVSDSSSGIKGDVNSDGEFNVADIVMLHNYIIRSESITDKDAGDLCEDGVIDMFDVVAMRKMLIS
ncbi:MAG: dockerin type I domain-containing protein [Ruminococcus sp.]|nr:dockerin type I domain-containing protein [Ruminococcus sp.]